MYINKHTRRRGTMRALVRVRCVVHVCLRRCVRYASYVACCVFLTASSCVRSGEEVSRHGGISAHCAPVQVVVILPCSRFQLIQPMACQVNACK